VFASLAFASLWLLRTALVDGPFWDRDYGLYGMQWGAKQLFVDTIPGILKQDPQARLFISSTWANGPENFLNFFLSPDDLKRVTMSGIQAYTENYTPLKGDEVFVIPPGEYQSVVKSKKFSTINVEQILNYPDGNPGFYFVKLAYVNDVEKIFEEEKQARLVPIKTQITLNGQTVNVIHSQTDAGQVSDVFDGSLSSLMRGREANPFFLEFDFPQPRKMSGINLDFSAFDYNVTIELYAPGSETPVHYETQQLNIHDDPHVEIKFDQGPSEVQKVVIRIKNLLLPQDQANIHVREIKFLP
jgi:hypothetical protein